MNNSIFDRTELSRFLCLADRELGLLSVFDDLEYDRSDDDFLNSAMRAHAIDRLKYFGFRQQRGTLLVHRQRDVQCLLPKRLPLGASPFDALCHTPKRAQDFYLLTPTQAACQIIDHHVQQHAVGLLEALQEHQPINFARISDALQKTEKHQAMLPHLARLWQRQKELTRLPPLSQKRALGAFF